MEASPTLPKYAKDVVGGIFNGAAVRDVRATFFFSIDFFMQRRLVWGVACIFAFDLETGAISISSTDSEYGREPDILNSHSRYYIGFTCSWL